MLRSLACLRTASIAAARASAAAAHLLPLPPSPRSLSMSSATPANVLTDAVQARHPVCPPHEASTTREAMSQPHAQSLSLTSCWSTEAGARASTYPALLGQGGSFDVVVVGGGIVGVQTAYELAKAGRKVALIEARTIGTGTTGWSTAKLTAQQNLLYTTLAKQHSEETARRYGQFNLEAIARVESLDRELGLGCSFARTPHATWTSVAAVEPLVRAEAELCQKLGLPAEFLTPDQCATDLPKSLEVKGAVLFRNQAAFNPLKYCVALSAHVAKFPGCVVHEHTRVTEVSPSSPHTLTLEGGGSLVATHVVLATHMPILDRSLHFSLLSPSRTVCISVRLSDSSKLPRSSMWISDSSTPMRSMRVSDQGELVIAGESFDQGNVTDTNDKYNTLEKWAREHFPVIEGPAGIGHRWSSMDFVSSTHMPYIGYLHRGCSTLYTATGMSKWGLANGVGAGGLIRDLIVGGEQVLQSNPYAAMFDARRWDLLKAGPGALKENLHTAEHLIKDKVKGALAPDVSKLKPGEGGLCKVKGEQVGAYLDPQGKYHLVKPICTHMGCTVVFNQGDKCWDCPCHGSQFTVDGEVIQGPACKPLVCMNHLDW